EFLPLTPLRLPRNEGMVDEKNPRPPATHAFIQINHERPRAVATMPAKPGVFRRARLEEIRVCLELLAHLVTLRLNSFRVCQSNADCLRDLLIDAECNGAAQQRQIAGLAGAKQFIVAFDGYGGRAQVMIDERDE